MHNAAMMSSSTKNNNSSMNRPASHHGGQTPTGTAGTATPTSSNSYNSNPYSNTTTSGVKEFISLADGEMKALMDYLELAGGQMKKGAELDEVNELKKYIALTLSHWKRNASVATEGCVELAGLLNLEKNVILSQQSIASEQDQLISLLTEENDNVNEKVKEAEGLLRSTSESDDHADS